MTQLGDLISRRIAQGGPITLAEYMAECLLHPTLGYYTTRQPFGTRGDFTTAPEISQMFGELLGLCLAQHWLDHGAPNPFTLAELGPGRGTLMADVLRATARVPGFHAAARVTLLEASAALQQAQRDTIAHPLGHIAQITDLPQAPLYLLANEFFDALPIRQFSRVGQEWAETMVGLTATGPLALGRAAPLAQPQLAHRLADTKTGDVVEICPSAGPIMATIAQRITDHGGLALIVDYGGWDSRGDTFQAMRAHAFTDPLADPGHADLTAHVDFAALARAAAPAQTAYLPQGTLLTRLGIAQRSTTLGLRLTGTALENHLAATHRLTDPAKMGELFKALAVYAPGAAVPPGFTP